MDIKILKCDNMVNTGSAVLRVIQNNEMPSLDLLVREAIQNSLDAKQKDKQFVKVEINIGNFDVEKLSDKFVNIEHKLRRIGELNSKFISFKDSNTTGLTGPVDLRQVRNGDFGKFQRLTMNIGKAQEEPDAGGSWGYGKTVYYRLGIGLVIYYTRIKEEEQYKSRLIACLVENERSENNIIPKVDDYPKSGIAWWGRLEEERILPIENENEIQEILSYFGISPFKNDETGTTIIIPYLNEEKLLKETHIEEGNTPWWCRKLESYILVSTQRWYSTRLMNKNFKGNPWLRLFINGEEFYKEKHMLPLFQIVQDLYNFNNGIEANGLEIKKEEIHLYSKFKNSTIAGSLMHLKITKTELEKIASRSKMTAYTQINNLDLAQENLHKPIICFCRKPGMILRYDTDGRWTNGLEETNNDEYLIALFVPNSENEIIVKDQTIKLEEYLRASEKADHDNWTDITQYQNDSMIIDTANAKIVEKIQGAIKRKLQSVNLLVEDKVKTAVGSQLNRQLVNMFLPKRGMGNKATINKIKQQNSSKIIVNHKPKLSKLILGAMEINEKGRSKKFEIEISEKDRNFEWNFEIETEAKNIVANSWEDEVKRGFPVNLDEIEVEELILENNERIKINSNNILRSYGIIITENVTNIFNICYGFKIKIENESIQKIVGRIRYTYFNTNISATIVRKKGDNNE